ncbi:bifunctional diaminohydroxyphosphoribosylaminopyrimidine deaminase/5-amino-6-(5-phosphoribosylamino)uracil reductase RibD [Paenactinomyces guangxiensis]|uniref:Riboflavin biosynthesis protein RibD n=1 Tax=Paenactinomyces guangxiensis TaxID=1490290 RepID=A0A7W1WTA7_9BACL|nr:bifunctional diaminohydroxyphosphoribosylaminopyrimidine deaminase/5-amino-6-(5-phosphoribosylamino)uracil reductase RibD [Paenactinomyces guangxiensis]MBA4495683.1 bifunctional diaminohydroxyphosphoribosylaminopyrimidine deaminase/5-amino-6-(5-phosphoribosylamino)uracil reductase RibD [Paenactinomyces guangxiensis]MBH8592671.1 bifunctional diaminohydroxyphosphoribosylaminopyrimidine deaminase/5-amino-6-(5-phosphoribosylamino)uracil reductase RibD [Paenactinomyces guangxiensis]
MSKHEDWMRLAYELAKSAAGQTSPNPMVGAVAVKEGRIIGSGAHLKAGTPHAEVYALNMAGAEAKGCTLYVTLEPCVHYGRTPPCTEKIISCGVKQVVIGSVDPDRNVSGKGISRMREAGIEVISGVLETECLKLNEAYFHHRRTGKPFVTLKTATTLDGKIATAGGDSRWITGEASRQYVHQLRHRYDAILVGVGTVLADNPRLTTRLETGGVNPLRVIVDSSLRIPIDANVVDTSEAPTWIFTTEARDFEKEKRLREKGVEVIPAGAGPRVGWEPLLRHLGEKGILSLLVEGGGEVNASLLSENRVQKVIAFIAPKLIGGKDSPTSVEGESPAKMAEARTLCDISIEQFGQDLCVTGYIVNE